MNSRIVVRPRSRRQEFRLRARKLNENPENEHADRLNGNKKLFSSNGISVTRKPFGSHNDERWQSCENTSTILFQFFELFVSGSGTGSLLNVTARELPANQ